MKYSVESVGKIIRKERERIGFTQADLGIRLHITGKQISNYEKGLTTPPTDILFMLCEVFNCELGYLLGEADYTDGSRLMAEMEKYTGLSKASLETIHWFTGIDKDCYGFGMESNAVRDILNRFLTEKKFKAVLSGLIDLQTVINARDSIEQRIIEKYGKDRYDLAVERLRGPIDYVNDPEAPKLPPQETEVMAAIIASEDEAIERTRDVRLERFELHEMVSDFIDSLYKGKD